MIQFDQKHSQERKKELDTKDILPKLPLVFSGLQHAMSLPTRATLREKWNTKIKEFPNIEFINLSKMNKKGKSSIQNGKDGVLLA